MAHVLVVDDDNHIREVIRYALERAGHSITEAKDGLDAVTKFQAVTPDLVVLDILMPEDDGLSVCRQIRKESHTPIIFLSSRDDELDRVIGLELGADDYMTKPFSPRELVARVAAVLRRAVPAPESSNLAPVVYGALKMDLNKHRCFWNNDELVLTVTEFALLQALAMAPGRVFERAQLVEKVYGDGYFITDRTVDSHIRRVRKKLATLTADPIETVYGVGYRFRELET